jgi:hypothetical protein
MLQCLPLDVRSSALSAHEVARQSADAEGSLACERTRIADRLNGSRPGEA